MDSHCGCFLLLVFFLVILLSHQDENSYYSVSAWSPPPTSFLHHHHHHFGLLSDHIINTQIALPPQTATTTSGGGGTVNNAVVSFWIRSVISALTTYVGFVAYCDRARGGPSSIALDCTEVRQSTVDGAGLGLFAKCDMPKSTVLGEYPGVVCPIQQHSSTKLSQYPQCEGYTWRFSDNQMVIDPTDILGNIQDACYGGNPSQLGSVFLFQNILSPLFPGISTLLCRINEPPIGYDVNVCTSENLDRRQVTFELERDVMEGEELFIDYGLYYDRSMYNNGGGKGGEE